MSLRTVTLFLAISVGSAASVIGQAQLSSTTQATAVTKSRRVVNNRLVEEFSFLIKDFKVDHQGPGVLNITVRYRYRPNIQLKDYPDFRWLAKDIENLLTNYPNETDYWEIVNKKITALLLDKYPALTTVTSQIDVSPSSDVPYFRTSTVTRIRSTVASRR